MKVFLESGESGSSVIVCSVAESNTGRISADKMSELNNSVDGASCRSSSNEDISAESNGIERRGKLSCYILHIL